MVDPRIWFLLQQRHSAEKIRALVNHVPSTKYRCVPVMQVFLAGFETDFKLTDQHGQPLGPLRLMVQLMGAELCLVTGLSNLEQRRFTHTKGVVDPIFEDRWFIRNITNRLNQYSPSAGYYGWANFMFRTDRNMGLMMKYGSETVHGKKRRFWRHLAVCPPDWELSNRVYEGLCKWTYNDSGRVWDAHGWLDPSKATTRRPPARRKGVTPPYGHAKVATAGT